MRGFHVPPVCQGQMVEVAYSCVGDAMLRRATDRSDGSVSYEVADIEDDDWSWYETYEQCNGEPPIPSDRWRSIDTDRALRLAREWD